MSKGAQASAVVVALLATAAFAADNKQEFRYTVKPGASIIVMNETGAVTVEGVPGRQVTITAITHSDKVRVDSSQNGNRIQAVTRSLEPTVGAEGSVEYELAVPPDASVTVRDPGGPITAEHLQGYISLEGDAAKITVHDITRGNLRVRTLSGPVTLANINGRVEVVSVSGDVQLTDVSGPKVAVNTTKGAIRYSGDFGSGGEYVLTNHSGNIDVSLPASASVDLTARSVTGQVEQDFPLRQKQHPGFAITQGRSFAGTSNSGSSSVQLRSFSGKIRVKKQ